MESLESTRKKQNSIDTAVHLEKGDQQFSQEQVADQLFDQYMKQQLIEDFFDNLADYLDEDHVDEMREALAEYEDADIYAALSLPHELRERKFEQFVKQISSGESSARDLIEQLVATSTKYGFNVGYHTSPADIKPNEDGSWNIAGLESDHRDADLARAYYSTKYRHLFKKKSPRFIYIVRTEPETHRTDGNWSRASNLSVITRVPFRDVVDYVERTTRQVAKENGTVDAAPH